LINPRLQGLDSAAVQQVVAAAEALDAGRVDEAEQHLTPVRARHPQHPEVLRMQAGIHGLRGQSQDAIELMREALIQRPQDAVYHNTLGSLLGNAGDYDGAIAALRRTCELQPSMAVAWYNLGVMLTRSVRNEEATAALQRAISLAPDHMTARALLADVLRMRGQTEQAASEYRRIIAEQPWAGMAWWGLADLKTVKLGATDIAQMKEALHHRNAGDEDLMAIGFALAKAYDDVGQYADSLAALAAANAVARRRRHWNREAFSTGVSAVVDAFAAHPAAATTPDLGKEVIFIVGLPRSGSTLVEQILASHSSVEGAGELPDLTQVLAEESRRRGQPFPRWVADMTPADWERLGHRYLERTRHWRQQRPMFTDKLPGNWIYLGAILAMLPGARIISCRRDPLETCFGCYRQRLDNNEYTRDFDDLAGFWRDFDRTQRHWLAHAPKQVYEHRYEALVADPGASIRGLLDFCGLPFEDACLNFHENRREVRSPSAAQVRQPLRQDSARSAAYGALLDPLRAALGLPAWQR